MLLNQKKTLIHLFQARMWNTLEDIRHNFQILWMLFSISSDLQGHQGQLSRTSRPVSSIEKWFFFFFLVGMNFSSWPKMKMQSQIGGKALSLFPPHFSRAKIWKLHLEGIQSSRRSAVLTYIWIRFLEPCQNIPYAKLVKTITPEQRNNTANHTDTSGTTRHSHQVKGQHHLATHKFINGRFTEI